MEKPSLRTLANNGTGAVRHGCGKAAAFFVAGALMLEGIAGCGQRHDSYTKNVDCRDKVCGPFILDMGERLRVRLPDGSEVIVEPEENAGKCGKITIPDKASVQLNQDKMLGPEFLTEREERRGF